MRGVSYWYSGAAISSLTVCSGGGTPAARALTKASTNPLAIRGSNFWPTNVSIMAVGEFPRWRLSVIQLRRPVERATVIVMTQHFAGAI